MNIGLINQYLEKYPPTISVLHVSSIIAWQKNFDFQIREIDGCLCVFANSEKSQFLYWPPIGPATQELIKKVFDQMNAVNPRTARIENIAAADRHVYEQAQCRIYDKANEYIYRKRDIIDYKGNAYKGQRHDVNLAMAQGLTVHEFQLDYKKACLALFDQWANDRRDKFKADVIALDMLQCNRDVHEIMMQESVMLGLKGIVIKKDAQVVAYSLGYSLNESTFVVLLEITHPAIKGLSAFTFQHMCQISAWDKFEYVNAMDDFGLPGVRQAKEHYHPIRIEPIYNATRVMTNEVK